MPLYLMVFPAGPDAEAGKAPPQEFMKAVAGYQEKMATEGKLIWAERLYPAAKEGVRLHTDASGNTTVEKGPFQGPSIGGYAIINVADIDEAVELVKAFPNKQPGQSMEIRRIINVDELPLPDEVKAKAKALRDLMGKNAKKLGGM